MSYLASKKERSFDPGIIKSVKRKTGGDKIA